MLFDFPPCLFQDNGGAPGAGGSNYPLRGKKASLWEGGIRAVGFIHSKLLTKRGYVNKELMDITDWYPTLLHLVGVNTNGEGLDGYNQWETLRWASLNLVDNSCCLHDLGP